MKKFSKICWLLLVAFLFGCRGLDLSMPEDDIIQPKSAVEQYYNVDQRTALYAAKMISGKGVKSIEAVLFKNCDTAMYLVNFKPDGWMMLSADKRIDPIVANSQTGSMDLEKLDNPGVATCFGMSGDMIMAVKQSKGAFKGERETLRFWSDCQNASRFDPNKPYRAQSREEAMQRAGGMNEITGTMYLGKRLVKSSTPITYSTTTGPLLQTKWGQGSPWNTNLPLVWNGTGLVAPPAGWVAGNYNFRYRAKIFCHISPK